LMGSANALGQVPGQRKRNMGAVYVEATSEHGMAYISDTGLGN